MRMLSSSWIVRVVYALGLGWIAAACEQPPQQRESGRVARAQAALCTVVEISDCAELQAMRNDLYGCYQLVSDIDCTGFDFGDGYGFKPVGYGGSSFNPFRGSFDGDGHVITGLTIDRPWTNWVGLFGLTYQATIERVGIEDADITGYASVAPLVGTAMHGTITECYTTGVVSGHHEVGGLVGAAKYGQVLDSYTAAVTTATSQQGVIAGIIQYNAAIHRTYSSGDMSASAVLAGLINNGGSIDTSFFDCDVAGNCTATGAASTSAMQSETQYTAAGWDFDTMDGVWGFEGANTYPCLLWQTGCGCEDTDATCDGIDEDCSGTADDDYAPQSTSCGVGACASTGSTSCVSGSVQDSCTPGTPGANDASCNGVDDDCNGATDEDYASQNTSCGVGACAATGSTSCVSGSVQDSCTPGTPAANDPTCDGDDDDCDAEADEDFVAFCSGAATNACVQGELVPTDCSDANVCNGAEGCASGACQPGTPLVLDDDNECTVDACDPATGVSHTPAAMGTRCEEDGVCDGTECVIPRSCREWLRLDPDADDGVYMIDVDGEGATAPFEVYCDMTTAGGGWQLVTVTRPNADLFAAGYCQSPSASCAGQLHPLQPSSRSQVLVKDQQNGVWLQYGGFSASSTSALRYFTRQLPVSAGQTCNSPQACAANTTADPGLTVQATSGFTVEHVLPLQQWWRYRGWWVGGDPNAGTDTGGRVHSSNYFEMTAIRSRPNRLQSNVSVGTGMQALFHRDDGCANGVLDGAETGIDCGGSCAGCAVDGDCSAHRDCASGFCDGGQCASPGPSCAAILAAHVGAPSGPYLIDVDGAGSTTAFQVYCDMTTDGGGWQLISSVRNDDDLVIVGDVYCTDPSPAHYCRGRMHPSQASVDTELMVRTPASGDHMVYDGFSAGAESALRYFTRELILSSSSTCNAPHACTNTTRDPSLHVDRTSGYPLLYNAPLFQWWRHGGWWVGASPDAGGNGRLHSSGYDGNTTLRSRVSPNASGVVQSNGHQLLQFRGTPVPSESQCTWLGQPAVAGTPCDDGDACGTSDLCDGAGQCQPGTPLPSGTPCGDGDVCSEDDSCNAAGVCQPGSPIDVDDGDPCTADTCVPGEGVLHTPVPEDNSCSDGLLCNGDETCRTTGPVEQFARLNPRRTYLRVFGDSGVLDARAYTLADLGVQPGDSLRLRRVGSFVVSNDGAQDLVAVFSSSNVLLDADEVHRVPGAIASGLPAFTTSRDIPEDFWFGTEGVIVTVPAGATHLFVSTYNGTKGDSTDADGDFGFMHAKNVPVAFGCHPGVPLTIDDDNACTIDACDPVLGVVHDPYPEGAQTCEELDLECGQQNDGCGVAINCGTCGSGEQCGSFVQGECGPVALPVSPRIHVSREVNVALYENGARALLADGTFGYRSYLDRFGGAVSLGSSTQPKTATVRVAGSVAPVVDRLSFEWDSSGLGADHFELWVSTDESYATAQFTQIETMAMPTQNGVVEVPFPAQRVRFMRLYFDNIASSGSWGGALGAVRVFTRAREGGVLSLVEGGAEVAAASSESRSGGNARPATSATDLRDDRWATDWTTTGGTNEWVAVEATPAGYRVSQLEVVSEGDTNALRDFEVGVSMTGIAPTDFTPVFAGTSSDTGGVYTFEFTPAAARYVRLSMLNTHGAGAFVMKRIRFFSEELGGAVVPFDDLTPLPAAEIASRLWDFGDGETSTQAHPVHTYDAPGSYEITLTVTDVQGRVGVTQAQYTVLQEPDADFDWDPKPVNESSSMTQFTDLSDAASGHRVLQRDWTSIGSRLGVCNPGGCFQAFDSATTWSSVQDIRYAQDGSYAVTLAALDSQLLIGEVTKPVTTLNVAPDVDAGPDAAGIWGEVTSFGRPSGAVADESPTDEPDLRCEWDFGDGTPLHVIDPCRQDGTQIDHVYADPGPFTAILTVFDDDTSTSDSIAVTEARRPTLLVPLTMTETAVDGDFEMSARLFDALDHQAPMVGFTVEFIRGGQSIPAVTGSDSIARATVHFEALTYSSVEYGFAGDARYLGSQDAVDFIVREGDTEPQEANPPAAAHEGLHFVLGFPQNADFSHFATTSRRLLLMLSARTPTTATVRAPGASFETTVAIQPPQLTYVTVPEALRMGHGNRGVNEGDSGEVEAKGIEVTSLDEISVYAIDHINGSTDGYLALPTERLGNDHLVLALHNEKRRFYETPSGSQIGIVATEDDTLVTITPNADVDAGPDLPTGAQRGEPFTIELDALETFQIHAPSVAPEQNEDLSGTRVLSDKPLVVYGGHVCAPLSSSNSACNHVIEQMPPSDSFGTEFITAPLMSTNAAWDGDMIRVLSAFDGTQVHVDDQLVALLDRGEVHHFRTGSIGFHQIVTSQPALVGQFARGADIGSEDGDPAFMLVPPVSQHVNRIVLSPPPPTVTGYQFQSFVNIVAKSSEVGSVRMNGQLVNAVWRAVGDGSYAAARMSWPPGHYVFDSPDPDVKFMVHGYGRAFYNSYMLTGGMHLATPLCRPTQTVPGDGIDNDCDGVQGEEQDNGIDDDGDGIEDEDLALVVDPGAPNQPPVVQGGSLFHFLSTAPKRVAIPGYDADGDALTYQVLSQPSAGFGTTVVNGSLLTFTGNLPSNDASFVVVASDGELQSAPATIRLGAGLYGCNDPLHVAAPGGCNDDPYFSGGSFNSQVIKVPPGQVVQFSAKAHAHDWDLHEITYALVNAPSGMSIDDESGIVSWLVDSLMAGTYGMTVTATDERGGSDSRNVTLTVLADPSNAPPVFDSEPVLQAQAGEEYEYLLEAHDPENTALTYQLLAGPAGMQLSATTLSWMPIATDTGEHAVLLRVTDAAGAAAVQRFTVSVLGSPLRFVSSPSLVASVDTEYRYQPEVVRPVSDPDLTFDFEDAPAGMQLDVDTGLILWTPTSEQLGMHGVVLAATDEQGHVGRQFFTIEVLQTSVVPSIFSEPVTQAIIGGQYHYDVDAQDLGELEVLSYDLVLAPEGMIIDLVTGLISWQPSELGSYPVTVRVSDSTGQSDEQSFFVTVVPDTGAPVVEITLSQPTVEPGGSLTVGVQATDDVEVESIEVTLNGQPVQLQDGQYVFSSTTPGVYTIVVTATDTSNNAATETVVVGVEDEADTQVPALTITSPSEDAELTYLHDIVGTVTDANLMGYTVEVRRIEDGAAYRTLGSGLFNASGAVLGAIDTTLLENGYYELRVRAEDVNGAATEIIRPVLVHSQAKVGPVQLSLVDMAVPMAGIPLTLVRSYDSRVKERRDFGYGWSLTSRQGSAQHNRKVGEGYLIYHHEGEFQFPCNGTYEQKSHYTEVRISERERYIFRPIVANTETVAGGCEGEVFYEQVEGTTSGAELFILGGLDENRVRTPSPAIVSNPEVLPAADLIYAFNPERGVFNPRLLQLQLRDGRKFNVRVGGGIERIEDKNGNAISLTSSGIHHTGGKSVFFERDLQGRITRISDPTGRSVRYAYDLNGDLARVTDPLGRETRFIYHGQHPHHLERILGPDGTELMAADYDESGRLSEVCDADEHCSSSSYDLEARTMTQTDATEREVNYEYDGRGNVTSQTDALGHKVEFEYDAEDNLIRAEGPDGSVATYTYDGDGNLLTRVLPHEAGENPADFTYIYTYTDRGDRATVTLPTGGLLEFVHDGNGNLTAVRDGAANVIEELAYSPDGTLASRTDRFGTVSYGEYNDSGQPTLVTDSFGEEIAMQFDDAGRLLSRTERGKTMSYAYDVLGRPTSVSWGDGVSVAYEYDDDADPRWTSIEGPTLGRVERTFSASGTISSWTEPNGDVFSRLYDAAGRVEEEIDALGNRTVYGYDDAGRLETITDVTLNATTTFERDSAGRVTKTIDTLGNETEIAYREGGRLLTTTNGRGFTTSFDRLPMEASITDALSRTTMTSLTQFGLPVSTEYPDGSSTGSAYLGTTPLDGSQGFPTSFADELSRERSFDYDSRSGLESATDLAGQAWEYTYAATKGAAVSYDVFSGNVSLAHHQGGASAYRSSDEGAVTGGGFVHHLQTVTSPLGETTQFLRGVTGRIDRVVYPDSGEELFSYGADAQLDEVTLPQGTTLTFEHDDALREVSRISSTGETRAFTYGPGDRIETMTDNTGTTTYEYDSAGRLFTMTYPHGGYVLYERDDLDRVAAMGVFATAEADPLVTIFDYDENGNLETLTDPLEGETSFVYDEVDRLVERTLPNGVTTTYAYDNRDRMLSIVHQGPMSNVLASVVYERSDSGEPTRITREDGSYVVVTYDSALRVDTETYYNAAADVLDAIDYDYDADGNRTAKTSLSGGYESYGHAAGFKLTSITTTAGTESYGYDGGGRLTSIDRGGVERELEYNSDDKLTRVVDDESEVVEYSYDGAGRRVGMDDGTGLRRYLVAPNIGAGFETPQAVTDASGNVLATYIFAGEHPVMRIESGQAVYYLQDAMGSVIGMADGSGTSTASIKYDAFGTVTSSSGSAAGIPSSVGTDFRYHGMQLDAATGLYHVRARTYDPRTGRFTSRDPMSGVASRPETLNPYAFNHNSPHVWRDPSGTFSLVEMMTTVTIIGITASIAIPTAVGFLNQARGFRDGNQVGGWAVNSIAGFGDGLSFGSTAAVRSGINWVFDLNDSVDQSSGSYWVSVAAGTAFSVAKWRLLALAEAEGASAAALARGASAGGTTFARIPTFAELPQLAGGVRQLEAVTRWTTSGFGAQAQAANMARTVELIAELPGTIQAIRAAGVTREMAQLWSRFYLGIARANPVNAAAGNANALPRSILMQAIANLL